MAVALRVPATTSEIDLGLTVVYVVNDVRVGVTERGTLRCWLCWPNECEHMAAVRAAR